MLRPRIADARHEFIVVLQEPVLEAVFELLGSGTHHTVKGYGISNKGFAGLGLRLDHPFGLRGCRTRKVPYTAA